MKYYFTFGFSHPLANHCLVVKAETENNAREMASRMFPQFWSSIYYKAPTDKTLIEMPHTAEDVLRNTERLLNGDGKL